MAQTRTSTERLEFIEATRGIAALLVLVLHTIEAYIPELAPSTHTVFDPGTAGVIAFFFVSGFVIPMTLERSGSQTRFWINRVFRIYPLYLTVLIAAILLGFAHVAPYAAEVHAGLPTLLALHLPILQGFTKHVDMVAGSWTLFIEFIFYASFAAAFAIGLNKRPLVMLWLVAAAVFAITAAGVVMHKRIPLGRPCLLLFAFGGFVFFRHWQGVVTTRALALASAVTLAVGGFAYWENFGYFTHRDFTFACSIISLVGAFAIFALAYAARGAFSGALKRPSLFVGALTYSVYLLHPVVIAVLVDRFGFVRWGVIAVPALSIPLAMLTYRLVERPGIEAGRRLGKRLAGSAAPAPTTEAL